ncbi:MAG: MlaE family lipid ABC transporter permease subunit [Rhizobium sp.]|nr:MlaE family lipid ABC transporter permease subunit [Rhizobium sp.]
MAETAPKAGLQIDYPAGGVTLRLSGDWLNASIAQVDSALKALEGQHYAGPAHIDLSALDRLDTGGAWLIRRLATALERNCQGLSYAAGHKGMMDLIAALPPELPEPEVEASRQTIFERLFSPLGRLVMNLVDDMVQSFNIIGSAVRGAQLKLGRGSGLSPAAVFTQLEQMGVNAVPIIALMSFLIGAIIAQQGAFQLRYFGAEIFVVDLVGILQLREIGVLLTAIMIAGRTGSAITAEIGSMKMREEIDALQVMGLNPVGVLIFPRLLALVIALPLLTIIANFAALGGAAVVTNVYSGITFEVFISRLQSAIDLSTVVSGMLKAPFMALIIGIVASVEGFKVEGSAESLGRHVTASVVKAIFVVILVDGMFAMFYAAINF